MTAHPPLGAASISTTELNQRTAEVLDRVDAGEHLAVTRHGVVVALLSPAREHPLAGLVAAGTPCTSPPRTSPW